MKILVTGSSGLVGSSVSELFNATGWDVHGIDNNQRAKFFGVEADTRWRQRILESLQSFTHHELDVRHRQAVDECIRELKPDAIVHAAAQPSHDLAATIPFADFDTNAIGTVNLLEAARRHVRDAVFVFMSTSKVYGDAPNRIAMREDDTRWEYADPRYTNGIPEHFPIDQSKHSLFGASKVAADIMTQEYGRYFGMKTCCLRGGCLTGPAHSSVELHGFLSYLVKCNVEGRLYKVFGYKGKQVRDNIHSDDVARFIYAFVESPRCGEVYNLGGGKENSCSILEAFEIVEDLSGKKMRTQYVDECRIGDHKCYYSRLRKTHRHYPNWTVTVPLRQIIEDIVDGYRR